MKNHYDIIGVNKNASTDEIRETTKQRISQLKQSSLNSNEIKKGLSILGESYKFLSDYHSRKKLDLYLENQKNDIFNNSFFNTNFSFPDIKETKTNSYYYSSSFTSNTFNKNGEKVTEEKQLINNNGKFNGKHTITTTDREGNEIIKEVPIKLKKDKKKLDYFIN